MPDFRYRLSLALLGGVLWLWPLSAPSAQVVLPDQTWDNVTVVEQPVTEARSRNFGSRRIGIIDRSGRRPPSQPDVILPDPDLESLRVFQTVAPGRASPDGLIRVALLLPLSGAQQALGEGMLNAAQMALFDLGDSRLRLLPRDTGGTEEGARQAAQDALADGAQLILGPLFAEQSRAIIPIAQSHGVAMLTFSTDQSLSASGRYVMGIVPEGQVARILAYARQQGHARFGLLAPQNSYGEAVSAAMEAHLGWANPPSDRMRQVRDAYYITWPSAFRMSPLERRPAAQILPPLTRPEIQAATASMESPAPDSIEWADQSSNAPQSRFQSVERISRTGRVVIPYEGGLAQMRQGEDADQAEMTRHQTFGTIIWDAPPEQPKLLPDQPVQGFPLATASLEKRTAAPIRRALQAEEGIIPGYRRADITRRQVFDPEAVDYSDVVSRFVDYQRRKARRDRDIELLEALPETLSATTLPQLRRRDTMGAPPFTAVLIGAGGRQLRSIAPMLPFYDIDGQRVQFLGTGLWDEEGLWRETTLHGAWFAAPPPAARQNFEKNYAQLHGVAPPRIATLAYDAVALAATLSRMHENEANPFRPDYLTDPRGFSGKDGLFRLHPDGRIERGLAVLEVTENGFRVIDPAPTRFQPE